MKKIAYLGMFTGLALICSYVESLFPISLGIPGVKLGLANVVTVFALYLMNTKEAGLISLARILLSGLMFGNLFGILYSLAGGVVSFCLMLLLKRCQGFSVIGVSIGGGVFHNIGQLVVATLVLESVQLLRYLPVLLLAGLGTGWLIGIVAEEVLRRCRRMER